jgi:DNA-binding transcriptional MerR regulator
LVKEKPVKKGALVELGKRLQRLPLGKSQCGINELIKITGLSRAQITFYEKTKLLGPALREYSKSRRRRPAVFYSEKDVLKALIISDMQAAGFSTHQLRTAIENLEDLGFSFEAKSHLLTNGDSVYVADTEGAVIDILRRHRQMLLLVSIEDQIQKVPVPKTA